MQQRPRHSPAAEAGGGSGGSGIISFNGGSGGGSWYGGGDGAGGDGESDEGQHGRFSWPGWRDRVAADPEFAFKVLIEQVTRGGEVQAALRFSRTAMIPLTAR